MSQNPKDITEKAYRAYHKQFGHPPNTATQLNKWARAPKGCDSKFIGVTWKTSSNVIKNPPILSNIQQDDTSNVSKTLTNRDNNMNNVSNEFARAQIPPNNVKDDIKNEHNNNNNNTDVNNIQNLNQNDEKCILQQMNNNTRFDELSAMRISKLKQILREKIKSKDHVLSEAEIKQQYNYQTFIEKSDFVNAIIRLESINKPDKQRLKRGSLFFQTKFISKEQIEHIKTINIDTNPKFLFGDNDIDNARNDNVSRKHHYGGSMGVNVLLQYDRSFGYGIVITFHNTARPGLTRFKQLIDVKFKELQQHLLNGYDVIIFEPTNIKANDRYKYFEYGKQIIYHSIASDINNFPMAYSKYIETKIQDLRNYSRKIATDDYYKYTAPKIVRGNNNRGRGGYNNPRRGGYNPGRGGHNPAAGRGRYNSGRGGYNAGRGRYNNRSYNAGRGGYNNRYRHGHKSYNNPRRGGYESYNNDQQKNKGYNSKSKKIMELEVEKNNLELKLKEYEVEKKYNEEMEKVKKENEALQRKVQKLQESGGIINVWEMQKNNGVFLRYDKTMNDILEKLAFSGSHCYSLNGQQYKITKTSKISGFQINTAYPDMKRNVRRIQIDAAVSVTQDSAQQISGYDAKQKILEIRKKTPCKYGDDCKWFKKGKDECEFLHEQLDIKGPGNNENEEYDIEGHQENNNDDEGSATAYV